MTLQLYYPGIVNSSAPDLSGSGNDGTINGATSGTGRLSENSFDLDGSTNYVDTGSTSLLNNTGYTVALWVNLDSTGSTQTVFSNFNSSVNDVYISADDGAGSLRYNHDDGGGGGEITFGSATTSWTHIVCQYDGSNQRAYQDGLESASQSISANAADSGANYNIGRRPDATNHTNGQISDVRVYNRALSRSEITYLYEAGQQGVFYTDTKTHTSAVKPDITNASFTLNNGSTAKVQVIGSPGTGSEEVQEATLSTNTSNYGLSWNSSHSDFALRVVGNPASSGGYVEVDQIDLKG